MRILRPHPQKDVVQPKGRVYKILTSINFSPIKVRFLSNTNPWRGKYYSMGIVESLSLGILHLLPNETSGCIEAPWSVVLLILPASPNHPIIQSSSWPFHFQVGWGLTFLSSSMIYRWVQFGFGFGLSPLLLFVFGLNLLVFRLDLGRHFQSS